MKINESIFCELSENLRTSCNSRTRGHTEKKCFCGSDSLDPNFSTISEFIHIVNCSSNMNINSEMVEKLGSCLLKQGSPGPDGEQDYWINSKRIESILVLKSVSEVSHDSRGWWKRLHNILSMTQTCMLDLIYLSAHNFCNDTKIYNGKWGEIYNRKWGEGGQLCLSENLRSQMCYLGCKI